MGNPKLGTVLDRVSETSEEGQLPIVVFDLDSTLFATAGRNRVILHEFAEREGLDLPPITYDELGWDPAGPLKQRGVDALVVARLYPFWKARFFSDAYVVHDFPNPGAVDYVQAVHDRGALVYYLTGRHVQDMAHGTVRSLTDAGFPYWRGRTVLHLKPSFHIDDKVYKTQAIADIASHRGTVVATFDNEPANCNLFQQRFQEALNFWVDTEHSPGAEELHPDLLRTDDFIVG